MFEKHVLSNQVCYGCSGCVNLAELQINCTLNSSFISMSACNVGGRMENVSKLNAVHLKYILIQPAPGTTCELYKTGVDVRLWSLDLLSLPASFPGSSPAILQPVMKAVEELGNSTFKFRHIEHIWVCTYNLSSHTTTTPDDNLQVFYGI